MRTLLFVLPAGLLMAQTPATTPPPKPAVAAPKPAAAKPATAAPKPAPAKPAAAKPVAAKVPETDDEKAVYALGLSIYGQMSTFDLTPAEIELLKRAIT